MIRPKLWLYIALGAGRIILSGLDLLLVRRKPPTPPPPVRPVDRSDVGRR